MAQVDWRLFPDDPKQAVRLKRFFMAALAYLLWVGLAVYCHHLGLLEVSSRLLWLAVLLTALTNLAWFLLIRSGLSLYWPDPSLTLPQMVVATFWVMLFVWAAPQARGALLVLYMVVFLFGVFRLNRIEYLGLTALALIGYGLILLNDAYRHADTAQLHLGLLQFLVLAVALTWVSFFGSYVGRLRRALRERNAELARALAENRELASHDDLTGAYNRRHILQVLEQERVRSERTGRPFSVCLLDLDHFKRVNDVHGHLIGDDVLHQFAMHVLTEVRAMDRMGRDGAELESFARYGGEEFLLVLPETATAGAIACAERLRQSVAAARFRTEQGEVGVSTSIGIAEYRRGEPIRELLRRADQALYRAKQGGRNRVATPTGD